MNDVGMTKVKDRIKGLFKHCAYKKNGVDETIEIYQVMVIGSVIKVQFYFDNTVVGELTDFMLVDIDDDVIDSKVDLIDKESGEGTLVAFEYNVLGV